MGGEGEKISLNLGYTKDGFAEKIYHVHLRLVGDNDGQFIKTVTAKARQEYAGRY